MSVRKKASLLTDFAMNAYVRDTARTVSRGFFRDKFAGYIIYIYIHFGYSWLGYITIVLAANVPEKQNEGEIVSTKQKITCPPNKIFI